VRLEKNPLRHCLRTKSARFHCRSEIRGSGRGSPLRCDRPVSQRALLAVPNGARQEIDCRENRKGHTQFSCDLITSPGRMWIGPLFGKDPEALGTDPEPDAGSILLGWCDVVA